MPTSYFFRVFVRDEGDYDNDEDDWVSFDSAYVADDFGRYANIWQDKDVDSVARKELQTIAMHKRVWAVVPNDVDAHTLSSLFFLKQQELIVATDIELYKYDNRQGRNEAILLSSMTFNSKITDHFIDSSGNYDFRFQIVGGVGMGDASDMSGLTGIAEKETQAAPSPPSGEEGRRLAAAFATTLTSSVRARFWVEAGLGALCGFLGILTLFTRDWIEALTGFDPDNYNGSLEWAIVAALFLVCILLSIAARADWRRLHTEPAGI